MHKVNYIVGCRFRYGTKSPDMDLYDLGFGEDAIYQNFWGNMQRACKYAIHLTCSLKLFWRDGHTAEYSASSDYTAFSNEIQPLIGKTVKSVSLNHKNDFFIEFDECCLIIITRNDLNESWRLFAPGENTLHLVSNSKYLSLQ